MLPKNTPLKKGKRTHSCHTRNLFGRSREKNEWRKILSDRWIGPIDSTTLVVTIPLSPPLPGERKILYLSFFVFVILSVWLFVFLWKQNRRILSVIRALPGHIPRESWWSHISTYDLRNKKSRSEKEREKSRRILHDRILSRSRFWITFFFVFLSLPMDINLGRLHSGLHEGKHVGVCFDDDGTRPAWSICWSAGVRPRAARIIISI